MSKKPEDCSTSTERDESKVTQQPRSRVRFPLTELGNAERFVSDHGEKLRFVHRHNSWFIWRGTHWVKDSNKEVHRLAKSTVRNMKVEAIEFDDKPQEKYARTCESEKALRAIVSLASNDEKIALSTDDLDQDPWLLNVENGTLNLRSGRLRPHNPMDHITHCLQVAYDPHAQCQEWDHFLDRALASDSSLKHFVQRAIGYSLTGSTEEQVLFFLIGSGANGKSTFLEVLREMFGTLAQQAGFETFLAKKFDGVPNDVARLRGVRFATAVEADSDRFLAEAKIKQLTGGDKITARFLYKEFFEFDPTFKIWLAANHRPMIRDGGSAIWRRIRIVPFRVAVPASEQDPKLKNKLLRELPGILSWAVEGCNKWRHEGLGGCATVAEATDEYRLEVDDFESFLAQCCVIDRQASIGSSDLYRALSAWLEENDRLTLSQKMMAQKLKARPDGLKPKKVNGRVVWQGIRLRSDESNESDGGRSGVVGMEETEKNNDSSGDAEFQQKEGDDLDRVA